MSSVKYIFLIPIIITSSILGVILWRTGPRLFGSDPNVHANNHKKKVAVIGAGFSGLTAALELRVKYGYDVTVYERLDRTGGRAQVFSGESQVKGSQNVDSGTDSENGGDNQNSNSNSDKQLGKISFSFDFGPSWYWFPDVFDMIFRRYNGEDGPKTDHYYSTQLLDPAYRIHIADEADQQNPESTYIDIPGKPDDFANFIADRGRKDIGKDLEQAKSAERISVDLFNAESDELYQKGMYEWIWKPMLSFFEFLDLDLMMTAFRLDCFNSFETYLKRYVTEKWARLIMKWPVIFVGASPNASPSMYRLMTYGGHMLGTWYPFGKDDTTHRSSFRDYSFVFHEQSNGFRAAVVGLERLAREKGVKFELRQEIVELEVDDLRNNTLTRNADYYGYRDTQTQTPPPHVPGEPKFNDGRATITGICTRYSSAVAEIENHLGGLPEFNELNSNKPGQKRRNFSSKVVCDRSFEGVVASGTKT